MTSHGSLDRLVTSVARRFMETDSESLDRALTESLQEVAEFFSMDTAFLRSNDLSRELSVLEAEWPRRAEIPDPDPLGEVPFDADPVFGATRNLAAPYVTRPEAEADDYQNRVKTGSGVDGVSMSMVPLLRHGSTTGVLGFVKFGDRDWSDQELNALQAIASLIVQLQSRVEAEEQLHFHAYHDQLTGVSNRRALVEHLEDRLANHAGTFSMFCLGVDRFKSVNGFLGQAAGDELLRVTAQRLQAAARPSDMVARLGGDEFIVVLDHVDSGEAAAAIALRLLEDVRQPISVGENKVVRTASIGVAHSDETMSSGEELLRNADIAVREAKAAGGDRICFFDQDLRQAEDERAAIEIGLRQAIDEGQLELHYQPEVDICSGELLGLEALVRWNHPDRGLVGAGFFIGVAEEAGLVIDLDHWVINEAIRQRAEWREALDKNDFTIRVNLSPAHLSTVDTVDFVASCLERHGLPGHLLCFEITEHALMVNPQQSIRQLNALRRLGITLAIDDFGTGYSSLTQLKNLPLDILKIDQAFVAGLGTSPGDHAIIEASLHLARSFDLDVVAEGIETPSQLLHLQDLGCIRGQGYFLQRPAPPADLAPILQRGGLNIGAIADDRSVA